MILKELFQSCHFDSIFNYIEQFYCIRTDKYPSVLCQMMGLKHIINPGIIYLKEHEKDSLGHEVIEVKCLDENNHRCSLTFTSWRVCLGMKVHDTTLAIYEPYKIAAHCLFDITYYGFDEETIAFHAAEIRKWAKKHNK